MFNAWLKIKNSVSRNEIEIARMGSQIYGEPREGIQLSIISVKNAYIHHNIEIFYKIEVMRNYISYNAGMYSDRGGVTHPDKHNYKHNLGKVL